MKSVILFRTVSGSTKLYAEWIKEAFSEVDLVDIDSLKITTCEKYDKIVIASRTYMGAIEAIPFMVTNWEVLKNKEIYLLVIGLVPQDHEASIMSFNEIPESIRRGFVGYKKVMGRINKEKLQAFQSSLDFPIKIDKLDMMDRKQIEDVVTFLRD